MICEGTFLGILPAFEAARSSSQEIKNTAHPKRKAVFKSFCLEKKIILVDQPFVKPFIRKIKSYFQIDEILVDKIVLCSSSFTKI